MDDRKWGFPWALLATVLMILFQTFSTLFFAVFSNVENLNSPAYVLMGTVIPVAICFLTLSVIQRLKGLTFDESVEFAGFKKPNARPVGRGAAVPRPFFIGQRPHVPGICPPGAPLGVIPNWANIWVMVFAGAGLFEEVFFRGFLFQFLRKGRTFGRGGGPLWCGLWSFTHFLNLGWGMDPETIRGVGAQVVEVFLLSFSSAYLFERGGNVIWGWMLVHLAMDGSILISTDGLPLRDFKVSAPEGLAPVFTTSPGPS